MLAAGVPVGLGVDGSASNDSSDMLGEVRACMLVHRLRSGVASMTAEGALRVACQGGARVLGYSDPDVERLTVWSLVLPEQRTRLQDVYTQVFAGRTLQNVRFDFLARDGRRVLLMRRGTEYVVVARRVISAGPKEALVAVLPMTGEELRFPLADLDHFQVIA